MSDSASPKDPRLLELELLARADRTGEVKVPPLLDLREKQMVIHLLLESVIHDPSSAQVGAGLQTLHAREAFVGDNHAERMSRAVKVSSGQEVVLRIGHKGRLRIADLRDQLKDARRQEKHGLLWEGTHWRTDVGAYLTTASETAPLSLVVLDANGMKDINERHGHLAGDEFLKTFFGTIKATFSGVGEAYCFGGDEVGVICPGIISDRALAVARECLRALTKAIVTFKGVQLVTGITSAAGITTTTIPDTSISEFIELADLEEQRAKHESRQSSPRPSVLAHPSGQLERIG